LAFWPSCAQRPALLAQVTEQRVVTADVLAGRPAALPSAERLHPWPRARRRARGAVDVDDARLDAVVEGVDLGLLAREQPGRQAEPGVVRAFERLVEAADRLDRDDRNEQLLSNQLMIAGQA